jgi:O-acetyl-ADP-ribose deacetylase (regulator of RNase III)
MSVYETGQLTKPRYIINFPTKRHWRGKSRLSDIEAGLRALVAEVERLGIRSIAVPPLGCGLGGLDWADVRPRIEAAHWVAVAEGAATNDETVASVYGWGERKRRFTPEQIELARGLLAAKGWIESRAEA